MKGRVRMDEAGAVVFPLEVRQKLHLDQGGELEYETVADKVELRAVEEEKEDKGYRIVNKDECEEEEDPPFKMVDGIMVIQGGTPTPGGVAAEIRRLRNSLANRTHREF